VRLTLTLTVQVADGDEAPVFSASFSAGEGFSSVVAIAEGCVRGTLKASKLHRARIREYLGPSLLTTIDVVD
jgi:hypothetical protein